MCTLFAVDGITEFMASNFNVCSDNVSGESVSGCAWAIVSIEQSILLRDPCQTRSVPLRDVLFIWPVNGDCMAEKKKLCVFEMSH